MSPAKKKDLAQRERRRGSGRGPFPVGNLRCLFQTHKHVVFLDRFWSRLLVGWYSGLRTRCLLSPATVHGFALEPKSNRAWQEKTRGSLSHPSGLRQEQREPPGASPRLQLGPAGSRRPCARPRADAEAAENNDRFRMLQVPGGTALLRPSVGAWKELGVVHPWLATQLELGELSPASGSRREVCSEPALPVYEDLWRS